MYRLYKDHTSSFISWYRNDEQIIKPIKINMLQIMIGAMVLLLGVIFYLIIRSPGEIYFLYRIGIKAKLLHVSPNLFGNMGNNLPSFIHVFSFILMTSGLISSSKRSYGIICCGWFVVDCAFELGQKYHDLILNIIPNFFKDIPILENCDNYFRYGKFDLYDLCAITVGTLMGYIVLLLTTKKGGKCNGDTT